MNPKLRIVLDTNVIISAFLKSRSLPRRVLQTTLQDHTLLLSIVLFLELKERLLSSKFDRYVSRKVREEFLQSLPALATYVTVTTEITDCRDPKDNKFLELAVDGHAHLIITGDHDLLTLNPFRGMDILTPGNFLERLERK
jgi:putative PIN family toxin of toxin-antitoxin system